MAIGSICFLHTFQNPDAANLVEHEVQDQSLLFKGAIKVSLNVKLQLTPGHMEVLNADNSAGTGKKSY